MSDALDKIDRRMHELHELVSRIEDDAVHRAARQLEAKIETAGRVNGPGLVLALDTIDPYERVSAFNPSVHEYNEGANSACAACREGAEHWHRKRDDKPVTWLPESEKEDQA